MMQRLIDEIRSIADVSDTEVAAFIESMEAVTVPKGDYFLKEGQVSRRMGYIERGLMMHSFPSCI